MQPIKEKILSQERLKSLLSYDAATGHFTRLRRGGNTGKNVSRWQAGQIAGYTNNRGYVTIRIGEYAYSAHRLAVLYMTGSWPKDSVDHRDGDFGNNAWANLRECTHAENLQNIKTPRTNVSGYVGVYRKNQKNKPWASQITVGGKMTYLGAFETAEAANQAYLEAKARLHSFQPVPREMVA